MPALRQYLVVCLIFAVVITTDSKSVKTKPASEYFNLCRRSDPKLGDCVKDNMNALREKVIVGIPELKLVPLDPMIIPFMELSEGSGNFRLNQKFINMTMYGLGKYVINNLDYTLDASGMYCKIDMTVSEFRITSKYEMDGRVLILPMKGSGDCVFKFKDVRAVGIYRGKIVVRQGKEYVDLTSVKWDLQVGAASSHFNNLFNGDKALGDATNKFLNDNSKEAFQTYKHMPEEAFGVVFQDITNQVYKRYPINELFLD